MCFSKQIGFISLVFGLLALWLTSGSCSADPDPYRDIPEEVVQSTISLTPYCRQQDLADFINAADEIAAKWRHDNAEGYYRFVVHICSLLHKTDFKTDDRFALAEQYALAALKERDRMPADVALGLLLNLRPEGDGSARLMKARLWLSTLEYWEKSMDRNFDPTKLPTLDNAVEVAHSPEEKVRISKRRRQERAYLEYFNYQYTLIHQKPDIIRSANLFFKRAHLDEVPERQTLDALIEHSNLAATTKQLLNR